MATKKAAKKQATKGASKGAKKQGGAKGKQAAKKGASKSKAAQAMKKWGRVVAKAWADDKFKQRLLKDPAGVLKEHGMEVPKGITVRAIENSKGVHHIVLPAKPEGAVLSDAQNPEVSNCSSSGSSLGGGCSSSSNEES
jgi:hypothetical protein